MRLMMRLSLVKCDYREGSRVLIICEIIKEIKWLDTIDMVFTCVLNLLETIRHCFAATRRILILIDRLLPLRLPLLNALTPLLVPLLQVLCSSFLFLCLAIYDLHLINHLIMKFNFNRSSSCLIEFYFRCFSICL